jgi:hypothetical protein
MRYCVRGVLVFLLLVLVSHSTASGNLIFDLEWGPVDPQAGIGSAVGKLTVDETLFLNPTSGPQIHSVTPFVLDFEITVSGATAGNGTFGFSEFRNIYWDTAGATFDLTKELIGQSTPGGPWGSTTDGSTGDFNMVCFLDSSAPMGTQMFVILTGFETGVGEELRLTSFRPAAVIPAPSALVLSLIGVVSLIAKRRR